jgi:phenylacetic acid degradation operon negative regulatory protein
VTPGSATAAAVAGPSSVAGARPVSFRPQALLLTVLGRHLLEREGLAVGAGTFIAVLERLGVSEQAARSTLTRMVRRGLLNRQQHGRRAYFSLTRGSRALLLEGRERIFAPAPVRQRWDGEWTLLSFSIPESRRDERHRLRARLAWNGFGLLRDGLWIAPGRSEVGRLIADLGLEKHVDVFAARALAPTDVAELVERAWDLDDLRGRYGAFTSRWRGQRAPAPPGDLATQIALITEWRHIIREDPLLPADYLPADWPALEAARLFHRLHGRYSPGAARTFASLLDAVVADDRR